MSSEGSSAGCAAWGKCRGERGGWVKGEKWGRMEGRGVLLGRIPGPYWGLQALPTTRKLHYMAKTSRNNDTFFGFHRHSKVALCSPSTAAVNCSVPWERYNSICSNLPLWPSPFTPAFINASMLFFKSDYSRSFNSYPVLKYKMLSGSFVSTFIVYLDLPRLFLNLCSWLHGLDTGVTCLKYSDITRKFRFWQACFKGLYLDN